MVSRLNASARAMAFAAKGKVYTAEQLSVLSKPTFVNGHWREAELNGRAIKRLRKESFLRGEEFPLPLKPTRNDVVDKDRKPKGHKHEILKAKR